MARLIPLALLVFLVAACGPSAADQESRFQSLEQRLLEADSVSFGFEIFAEGLLEADLEGAMGVARNGEILLEANGSFIGRAIQMRMTSSADSLFMDTNEMSDAVARPAATYEALMIGLTRMGILHNLAALSTVSPPERADGGIRDWVTAGSFRTAETEVGGGIGFDMLVEGDRTSEAVLVLDENGLPVLRTHRTEFPGGAMEITERYSNFVIR